MTDTDTDRSLREARAPFTHPVPAAPDDWVRRIKFKLTLNDQVESIHKMLLEDNEYLTFLSATDDSQAVEGSMSTDNVEAARRIREKAADIRSPVAQHKLHSIVIALNVVLKRYGVSRKERKNMVGGEIVENGE